MSTAEAAAAIALAKAQLVKANDEHVILTGECAALPNTAVSAVAPLADAMDAHVEAATAATLAANAQLDVALAALAGQPIPPDPPDPPEPGPDLILERSNVTTPEELATGALLEALTITGVVRAPTADGKYRKLVGVDGVKGKYGGLCVGITNQGALEAWVDDGLGIRQAIVGLNAGKASFFAMRIVDPAAVQSKVDGSTKAVSLPNGRVACDGICAIGKGVWSHAFVDPMTGAELIKLRIYRTARTDAQIDADQAEWVSLIDDDVPLPPDPPVPPDPPTPPSDGLEPVDNSLTQVAMLADSAPQQRWDGFGFSLGGVNEANSLAPLAQANRVRLFDELKVVWTGGYQATNAYAAYAKVCKDAGVTGFIATGQCATGYSATYFADQIKATIGSCFWTHASLQNEPDGHVGIPNMFSGGMGEIVVKSQELRSRLDALGLQSVKVTSCAWSHSSGGMLAGEFAVLQATGKVPGVVMAGNGHAYGDNPTAAEWDNAWARYKPQGMIQTECGYGHPQTSPARMLSWLNNGGGVFLHFEGQIPKNPSADGLSQGLVLYDGSYQPWHRAYQVINRDLSLGSLFRLVHCSDRPPGIDAYHADRMIRRQTPFIPRLYASVAKRPDGKWWLAVTNGTFGSDYFNNLGGHYGAKDFQVTFRITGLAGVDMRWAGRRSDSGGSSITTVSYGMKDGYVRLSVRAGQTVALVSE